MQFATIEDYEARHGDVPDGDRTRVGALLDDASALVLAAVEGSTEDWVSDAEAEVPRPVVMVCVAAARRAMRGSDGVVREQLGEHAVTYRADSSWEIWLTSAEVRTVRREARIDPLTSVTLASPFSGDADATPSIYDDLPL